MIRRAAAVILHRRVGDEVEVFLAQRSPKLRFLGGYHAFPGGVVDDDEAVERCAVRELFEETGVFLGDAAPMTSGDRDRVRAALLDRDARRDATGASPFREVPRAAREVDLDEVCRILTPPFAPVRYDTVFFLAELPDGESPEVIEGELVSGRFWRPDEALAEWTAGRLPIAPPVLILLEVLARVGLDDFARTASGLTAAFAAGALPPVRFTPGVVMASLRSDTLPPATTTNTYVVGNEKIWVLDPGTHETDELERLHDLLVRMQEAGREVMGVVLTHHHQDHAGGVRFLCDALELPVRGHPLTLDRIDAGTHKGEPIEDGDRLPLGAAPDGASAWSLTAHFTPGHARGHLAFVEDRYHSLFAGDMVSTVSTILIDPPEGHLGTYLGSLQKLRALPDIGTLYPAHGPPAPARKVIDRFLDHRAQREAKLVAALRDDPQPESELVQVVYDDVPPAALPVAARSLRAGLDKLGEEGRAAETDEGWRLA